MAGQSAYTQTTADFTVPAIDATVEIAVGDTQWLVAGLYIYIEGAGYYQIDTILTTTTLTVENTGFEGNAVATTVISTGAKLTPSAKSYDYDAEITALDARTTAAEAAIVSEQSTRASDVAAVATDLDVVEAQVNIGATTVTAVVAVETAARAAAFGEAEATWGVELDVNGHIVGIKQHSSTDEAGAATDDFIIVTSDFKIVAPTVTAFSSGATIFEVITIGGTPRLVMKGDVYVRGVLDAAVINTNSLLQNGSYPGNYFPTVAIGTIGMGAVFDSNFGVGTTTLYHELTADADVNHDVDIFNNVATRFFGPNETAQAGSGFHARRFSTATPAFKIIFDGQFYDTATVWYRLNATGAWIPALQAYSDSASYEFGAKTAYITPTLAAGDYIDFGVTATDADVGGDTNDEIRFGSLTIEVINW